MTAAVRVEVGDGLSIFVRTDGRHGTRAPLVCLPGLTRNGRDFTRVAQRWSRDRLVVRIDLRGRGESSYADPSTYTPQHYVADVVAVLDAFGIDRAVLLGTSLGGSVSMTLNAQHPQRVAGVILNDVGPVLEAAGFARIQSYAGQLPSNASWADAAAQLKALAGPVGPLVADDAWATMVREQYREFAPGDIRPDHDPSIVAGMAAVDPSAIPTNWPLFDALAGVPTLVLRGALSDLFSASTLDEMARRKPDLVAITVADRGHCPLFDESESIAAIDVFLATV
jgi:pimeloyl-ACP methyl ester carboxylesterase